MRLWTYIAQTLLSSSGFEDYQSTGPDSEVPMSKLTSHNSTMYFGYGSNLWQNQMSQRCPTSTYLGIARLNNYRWIINERGYANVVELNKTTPSPKAYEDEVWGLVYTLQSSDEKRLDRNEGVPIAYTKEWLKCDYWPAPANISHSAEEKSMLVYINRDMVEPDDPKEEYVYRMNKGIQDALKEGVPEEYVKKVMRPVIPELEDERVERVAREQALEFRDER